MPNIKKVELQNKGISQDVSISKEILEFAFDNRNIRIQANNDSTLLSVTNIQGPKIVSRTVWKSEKTGTATAILKSSSKK